MHLAHDVPAMKLDGELGYVQLGRNLFIQQAGNHLPQDLLLADSQRRIAKLQLERCRAPLPGTSIAFDSLLDGL